MKRKVTKEKFSYSHLILQLERLVKRIKKKLKFNRIEITFFFY